MTTLTHSDDIIDILNSVNYHIRNHQFNSGGSATTILSKYGGKVVIGYPKDLRKIKTTELPLLAVDYLYSTERKTYHWTRNAETHGIVIYGFCGGLEGGEANMRQMYQLMNDLKNIFNPTDGIDYINLYDYSTGSSSSRTKLDSIQVKEVDARVVKAGMSDTLEVSKYRFQVGLSVVLFKSQ